MDDEHQNDIPRPPDAGEPQVPGPRPRFKKRRLLLVSVPLILLAGISTAFGMMMAVASDLPDLESAKEFRTAHNSLLFDRHDRPLGVLTSDNNRVLVTYEQISSYMRNAIVAIEDRRFFENSGVDLRGIGRAFAKDITSGGAVQGGSTIAQQFVKNALRAQNNRTVFQKLRESALAYHLTRKWSKQKILKEYLNSIYFGNGAYGIESAARVYFGRDPAYRGCGTRALPCASKLSAPDAALIAGVVANPSAFDPLAHPAAAKRRRDLVLLQMYKQGRIPESEYRTSIDQTIPTDIQPPTVDTKAPYFTTWVSQQLVEHFSAGEAFEGGLHVRTSLDLDMQRAAQSALATYVGAPGGPAAALVAIDNRTGEVRALANTTNYRERPFNLATQGQRQPGSTVKPFILASALRKGYGLGSTWESRKRVFTVPNTGGKEKFVVNNFDDSYAGVRDLGSALTYSDNAVFAAVGIATGTKRIARFIRRMGVRTPVSSNPAMTLGAFSEGVSALDWAHAYESFASGGERVWGSLGARDHGPVGIEEVSRLGSGKVLRRNRPHRERVLSPQLAQLTTQQMETVVRDGTGKRAAYGGFAAGKTGTTENFGDAWFAGFTDRLTVAVWVGYPDSNRPMKTEFGGQPVAGGTYPALIWHDFALRTKAIFERLKAQSQPSGASGSAGDAATTTDPGTDPTQSTPQVPQDTPAQDTSAAKPKGTPKTPKATPQTPAPAPAPTPAPTPTPATPPATPPAGADGSGGAPAPSG